MPPVEAYTAVEIRDRLAPYPHWTYEGDALRRRFATANFRASLLVAMAIGHLSEAAWHHPELVIGYDHVVVTLSTHTARGVTAKDFELAAKIEAVIAWRPGLDSGALTGPPDKPPHAYLRDD